MEPDALPTSDARLLFDSFELGSGSSDCSAAIGFAECGPGCAWCDALYVCVDRWQDCMPPERAGGFPVLLLLACVGAVGLAVWSGGGARGVLSKLGVRTPDDDDFEPRDADSHRASYSLTGARSYSRFRMQSAPPPRASHHESGAEPGAAAWKAGLKPLSELGW